MCVCQILEGSTSSLIPVDMPKLSGVLQPTQFLYYLWLTPSFAKFFYQMIVLISSEKTEQIKSSIDDTGDIVTFAIWKSATVS